MSFSIEENDQSNEIAMSFFELTAGKLRANGFNFIE
jgi:hypothetical protein